METSAHHLFLGSLNNREWLHNSIKSSPTTVKPDQVPFIHAGIGVSPGERGYQAYPSERLRILQQVLFGTQKRWGIASYSSSIELYSVDLKIHDVDIKA